MIAVRIYISEDGKNVWAEIEEDMLEQLEQSSLAGVADIVEDCVEKIWNVLNKKEMQ